MYLAGIDLGTSNSSICIFKQGIYELIKESGSNHIIPSIVGFDDDGIKYGSCAKEALYSIPSACDTKCFIGLHELPSGFDMNDCLGYYIGNDEKGKLQFVFEEEEVDVPMTIYPENVSALILRYLVRLAAMMDYPVSHVVLTIPATYSLNRIHAVLKAAELAGLTVLRIVHEPCAAAFAYCSDFRSNLPFNKLLVYDLGGGTLDLSLIENDNMKAHVCASAGNNAVGGRILDICFAEWINKQRGKNAVDKASNGLWELRKAAEFYKIQLSELESVDYEYDAVDLFKKTKQIIKIFRSNFEQTCKEILDSTINDCELFLQSQNLDANAIDLVLLVGGSSKIPYIERSLENIFNSRVQRVNDPDGIVARGAAMIAVSESEPSKSHSNITIKYTYPYSIFISWDEKEIIEIFKPGSCITDFSKTMYSSEITLLPTRQILVYTMENENRICIGYFAIPQSVDIASYTFSIRYDYELMLSLRKKNGEDVCQPLSVVYYQDIDEQCVEETKLVNRFVDLLMGIKRGLQASELYENRDEIISFCNKYLSFEKYYRLCITQKDVAVIQSEYEKVKNSYASYVHCTM